MLNRIKNAFLKRECATKREMKTEDEQYIEYCIALEQTLHELESHLHDSDDPQEIAHKALKTTCEFYGGDWCGVLEVDTDLGLWTPSYWYNPYREDNGIDFPTEFEPSEEMTTWFAAMHSNDAVIVPDVEAIRERSGAEYAVYKRLKCKSLVAVPFKPRPFGFLVVRNPSNYISQTSMLNNLAYVILNAINQKRMMESAKTAFSPAEIKSDKDIIINLFDTLEIYTEQGVLHEFDFKSPKICRLLTYMILNRRTIHPPLTIVEALWPEESADPDAQINSLRGLIYRFRQTFALVSKYQLIETTPNGYRLNPELNIMTDLQRFDNCWDAVQNSTDLFVKIEVLSQAMEVYRGPVYKNASSESWLVNTATHYSLQYVGVVNELLSTLADAKDYSRIHQFATHALDIMPGNVKARYWLIYAMYKMSTIELAHSEIDRAKAELTSEEYSELLDLLGDLRG